jgi:TRAP-type mannitol/chloroaromatic compound transport system permease large subunit
LRRVAAAASGRIPPAVISPNNQAFVLATSQRGNKMSVLQINWSTFLMQITGLVTWVLLAAAIYALVENHIDGRRPR